MTDFAFKCVNTNMAMYNAETLTSHYVTCDNHASYYSLEQLVLMERPKTRCSMYWRVPAMLGPKTWCRATKPARANAPKESFMCNSTQSPSQFIEYV